MNSGVVLANIAGTILNKYVSMENVKGSRGKMPYLRMIPSFVFLEVRVFHVAIQP